MILEETFETDFDKIYYLRFRIFEFYGSINSRCRNLKCSFEIKQILQPFSASPPNPSSSADFDRRGEFAEEIAPS